MVAKNYCCEGITLLIEDEKSPLKYERARRRYYLSSKALIYLKKNEVTISYEVYYCPECGSKLPENLANEWSHIVRTKCGMTDEWDDEQLKHLPQEFKTDEWWKKRGL